MIIDDHGYPFYLFKNIGDDSDGAGGYPLEGLVSWWDSD